MCFHTKQTKDAKALAQRFDASFPEQASYQTTTHYNGFDYPKTPIINHLRPDLIQLYHWGLLPHWAKSTDFRQNTLNAKVETLAEKPSFKEYQQQRCLILIDGFYEWQWLDTKGKNKQKYLISMPDDTAFALAGIWNTWHNPNDNTTLSTYTIITTEANAQMSVIHNSKKRMPFILLPEQEKDWLLGKNMKVENNLNLKTEAIIEEKKDLLLFF
jgi:putative SOS response-associated peptidase YedK